MTIALSPLEEIAVRLAAAYDLLLTAENPALEPAREAIFDALASLDNMANGIGSPFVRAMLDSM